MTVREAIAAKVRAILKERGAGEGYECIRCGERRPEPFRLHRPRASGVRTCNGTVVRVGEVEATRRREDAARAAAFAEIGRRESGWRP